MPKLTTKQLYDTELKRVVRDMEKLLKKGFDFDSDYAIPQSSTPTHEDVERLQAITFEDLLSNTTYYDPASNRTMSGKAGMRLVQERTSAMQQHEASVTPQGNVPYQRDKILEYTGDIDFMNYDEVLLEIQNWQAKGDWDESYRKLKEMDFKIAKNILNGAIADLGADQVAKNIESRSADVKGLLWNILYGNSDFKWDSIEADIIAFSNLIRGTRGTSMNSVEYRKLNDMITGVERGHLGEDLNTTEGEVMDTQGFKSMANAIAESRGEKIPYKSRKK